MVVVVLLVGVLAAASVQAAEPASSGASRITENTRAARPSGSYEGVLTEEQLAGWLRTWQRRLSLDDWQIETKIVRVWELPQGALANIHWSLPKKKATIKVMHPIDSSLPKNEIAKDTELSVIHELVHLSMAKLPLDPNHTELEEETVKKISVALLALDKEEKR